MKRFVIFDSVNGCTKVTNSKEVAERFCRDDNYMVFDTHIEMETFDGLYYPPEDLDDPSSMDVDWLILSGMNDSDEE